ncbi:MAG TPA: helix-turn-helix domain-containing protein [Pyrinomonadaceae bacterium]|nr:helix-turn-helix domain-containing protein [Pyrinomonadaceae bacterium]
MNSLSTWRNERLELLPPAGESLASSRHKITTVKELATRLLREVQAIREVEVRSLGSGIDFYAEVSRFEVDLIKCALLQTAGHQRQAARLLNLKVTTLNSKIKHYNINLNAFAAGYAAEKTGDAQPVNVSD